MKVVLFGANGQLGHAYQELSKTTSFPIGWTLVSLDRTQGDLSHPKNLMSALSALKPDVIVNAAAYTQVDLAEKESALADAVNAESPKVLAAYAKTAGIPLVHFSTDYVYRGDGTHTHSESEAMDPQNAYGKSKARGDEEIAKSGCDHLIFRTSWVYSFEGKNFVKTMLKLGSERSELKVVNDQTGSPTYAPDLAMYSLDALMQAMEKKSSGLSFPSGVYHLSNSGLTTWCEFAQAIVPKTTRVIGIPSSDYPTPAKRPLNSRLSLDKFKSTFGISPRPWTEALSDCLNKLGAK